MSWLQKLKIPAKESAVKLQIQFTAEKEAFYYIKLADPAKRPELLDKVERKLTIHLEEYGTILLSGWGKPTEEHRKIVYEQHGFVDQEAA